MSQITLPHLGENIDSGDVLSILVSEGDAVTKDQDLIEIETDKATMAVPSPQAGKIVKILVGEGDTVNVGAAIFEIEAGDAAPAKQEKPKEEPPKEEAKKPEPKQEEPKQEEKAQEKPSPKQEEPKRSPAPSPQPPAPAASSGDVPGDGHASSAAGPAVRRLARELGVDLRRVRGSGEGGRLTEEDVRGYVRAANEQARSVGPSGIIPPGAAGSDSQGAVRIEKMSRMRQAIANNMVASYTTVPQLTNFDDVDISELEELREQSKRDYEKRGLKLTQMPFLIKAVAASLKLHPVVNASVDMEQKQVIYKEYVNIGVAIDTERGLTVPVIRDADRMSMSQITHELDRLIKRARDGELAIEEMRGGTFTISNLGAVGGTYSTPIINPPESAILLVGRSRILPLWIDGEFEPRPVMPLSLTYDHRTVDGAAAARFLNEVKGFLASPGRLLLAP
ncbi:Dihydrolipoyllysine-residue acetyltransferase component of pyruvate dehydrogenase complex [Pirellulimonas nuda]|uniref:Dihydrolipoamide acetyltransferase component of pyruvate dehydrogenase complex n=1 Tax=Pirellulimonas nuda TaxID=2528009 RepID=A0A518D5J4_9BACT|nr:2-oxo acid dehydrogenase subunit E2 [Pirellulimonas nuda]QDU86743.1 Dihydrolipoyllysine-residue acetyltransferase component of pyruvate dehydrogenase complex [Pirellulimonas nuda]